MVWLSTGDEEKPQPSSGSILSRIVTGDCARGYRTVPPLDPDLVATPDRGKVLSMFRKAQRLSPSALVWTAWLLAETGSSFTRDIVRSGSPTCTGVSKRRTSCSWPITRGFTSQRRGIRGRPLLGTMKVSPLSSSGVPWVVVTRYQPCLRSKEAPISPDRRTGSGGMPLERS